MTDDGGADQPKSPSDESTVTVLPDVGDPQRIGPFRVLQKIGEGGMGIVYEVEQEKPVRRRVALKLIKWGMDTKQVVARFEAERQALALMSHPNVAKVFDAGATPEGRPYFVMEYVKGVPITEHCDRQRLTTRERLELFMEVCAGVQHAHQKGIIHRDVKPSNILVEIHEGRAIPKIIDFGVAKATAQRLTEHTLFTALGQLVGTPEYMSPEQAEMTNQDVDTRTDVYSLAVVLYELLAGALPFDPKELRKAGVDEIRRRIREEEPSKPSTKISTLGDTATDLARKRHTDPRSLVRELWGDLDWITMKGLEKDRARRYGSPSELALDIGRHLAAEPVDASPPNQLYRLRKLVRRRRGIVITIGAVFLTLVVGTGVSTWQAVRAARAENRTRVLLSLNTRPLHEAALRDLPSGEVAGPLRYLNAAYESWSTGDYARARVFMSNALVEWESRGYSYDRLTTLALHDIVCLSALLGDTDAVVSSYKRYLGRDRKFGPLLSEASLMDPELAGLHDTADLEKIIEDPAWEHWASTKSARAWFAMTGEPVERRDFEAALRLALEANEMTGFKNAVFLATLAMAHYRTGRVPEAIETQKRALALLPKSDGPLRAEFGLRLADFEAAQQGIKE